MVYSFSYFENHISYLHYIHLFFFGREDNDFFACYYPFDVKNQSFRPVHVLVIYIIASMIAYFPIFFYTLPTGYLVSLYQISFQDNYPDIS